jgi:group I intron endonuclease
MDTYTATNTINGKFYIGSTKNFEKRKKGHLQSKDNYPFQNALRKNPEVFEWEVWSDDSDEPVLEQALLDMWFGTEQCYNLNPLADRPPKPSLETLKENGKKLSKHLRDSGYYQSEKCKEIAVSNGKTAVEKLKLEGYYESETHIENSRKGSQTRKESNSYQSEEHINGSKKGGNTTLEKGLGIFDPEYKQSEKYLLSQKKASEAAAAVKSREITLVSPEGVETTYSSLSEVERQIGIPHSTLCRLAASGKLGIRGKAKGFKARYTEDEG